MLLLISDCYAYKGLNGIYRDNNCPRLNGQIKRRKMQNFVLAGKAKTVFRILELKAKREVLDKRGKILGSTKKK